MALIPLKESSEEVMLEITHILKKHFKNHLLLVGAKGSIARNKFTPYSDFDLIIVVDNDKYEQWPEFMYNTTYIDVQVISLKNILKIISNVNSNWPAEVGGKLNLKIYYDNNNTFKIIKKEFNKIIKNKNLFENEISLNTVIEYYSKSERYFKNEEVINLRWACGWLFEEFSMILALLNQRYFTVQGPTAKIKEMSTFKYLPAGWKQICQNLLSVSSNKNINGARKLIYLLMDLSKKYKFANHKIKSIKEIRFK